MTMKETKLTRAQEQCLRNQVITADQPGPVLRDFRVLLEFLELEGVEAGGKYNLLPMKIIGELDQRLSRPLHLKLQRPQLRSHPYLQGLNLLLRASGLSRIEGVGPKARLVLDPAMLAQWDRLNPTEQYFNLMEAWLRFGRAEMVGEMGPSWGDLLVPCLQTPRSIPEKGLRFNANKPQEVYVPGIYRRFYLLALMDLFGILEVEQPRRPVTTWSPAGVKHLPFGDAVFTLIAASEFDFLRGEDLPQEEDEDQEDEDQEDGAPELPRFGAWQSLFQPYFPEWRENLKFPESEPREGEFIFRVTLGKIWRLIAMPADTTLDDLVSWILRSVQFDSDHLYEFKYRDRLGASVSAGHPAMDEGPWAAEIPIGTLPLEPGQTMQLVYDFGDNWRFTVKLERIEPPGTKAKAKGPRILESHGKAPLQYEEWDE
jgi:pRiA4b ORF-3-like protein